MALAAIWTRSRRADRRLIWDSGHAPQKPQNPQKPASGVFVVRLRSRLTRNRGRPVGHGPVRRGKVQGRPGAGSRALPAVAGLARGRWPWRSGCGGGHMGVAAAELRPVGAADPVEQPASVVEAGVSAHEIEDGAGVLGEVVGQLDGAGEGVGVDRLSPAVAEVVSQVQQASEPAGRADELGCPASEMGEVAVAGVKPRLQVPLEAEQQLGRLGVRTSTVGSSVAGAVRLAARAWSSGCSGQRPLRGPVGRRPVDARPGSRGGCRGTGPAVRGPGTPAGSPGPGGLLVGRRGRWSGTGAECIRVGGRGGRP